MDQFTIDRWWIDKFILQPLLYPRPQRQGGWYGRLHQKEKNLPVNQEPHRLQFPATESEWSKCLVSKENQLKVRISSFDSLSEVDILPPCLPLQELHLLAESSFLKTLAELQLLIPLEACWGGTTRGLKFSLPGPSRAATILEYFFFNFRNYGSFWMQISPWKQHAANWGPKDEMNPLLTVKKCH